MTIMEWRYRPLKGVLGRKWRHHLLSWPQSCKHQPLTLYANLSSLRSYSTFRFVRFPLQKVTWDFEGRESTPQKIFAPFYLFDPSSLKVVWGVPSIGEKMEKNSMFQNRTTEQPLATGFEPNLTYLKSITVTINWVKLQVNRLRI